MTNMISSGYVALDFGAIDIDWDNHYWRIFGINGALFQPSVCCVRVWQCTYIIGYVAVEYGTVYPYCVRCGRV